jgi:glycosyltransferase involved in cell wall biosynthesis
MALAKLRQRQRERVPLVKIAYVTDAFTDASDRAAHNVRRAVVFLRRAGHRVQLLRPRQPGEGGRHDDVEWRMTGGACSVLDLPGRLGCTAMLRREFSDPVHAPDHVHVASCGPLALKALRAARACGIRTSADYTDPAPPLAGRDAAPLMWRGPLRRFHLRRLHALADTTFVPTAAVAAELQRLGFDGVQVIGRGVDGDQFSPSWRDAWQRQSWSAQPNKPVLLYVGALHADQNVALALETCERLRAEHRSLGVVVVGDGPLRWQLKARHPYARFVGAKHGNELARHYASADLLLLPSLVDEYGDTMLEAMASGLAVVAFDTAAARRHMADGTGVIARSDAAGNPGDAFLAAARQALDGWTPDGPQQSMARDAAIRAAWQPTLEAFERGLSNARWQSLSQEPVLA